MKKNIPLLLVLILLLLASLACSTVLGGGAANSAEATAQAASTEAQATFAAVEATAGNVLDDLGDDADAQATEPADDGGTSDAPAGGDGDYQFAPDGPEDVPLMQVDGEVDAEILFADSSNLSYYSDADFDSTVDFYREAMPDLGWELSPDGDIEFAGVASLQYERDGDIALIAITTDPTSDRLFVVVTIQ